MAKTNLENFNYQKVAQADADMWRSYYNHQFFKMSVQLFKILKAQVGLNWYLTTKLAYYAGWAAADYRLNKGKENDQRIIKNLAKFEKIISDHAQKPFDYQKAAQLEYEWWQIHRYPDRYKKDLTEAVAEVMAVVYHVSPSSLKDYGCYRAKAMLLPEHTGDKNKTDPDELYAQIKDLLEKSWHALYKAVQ